METYKVSEELVEIFKLNGFKDLTNERYPEHYERMLKYGYDLYQIKRYLKLSIDNYVILEYINIHVFCKNMNEVTVNSLNEAELKSIFAFYELPANIRKELSQQIKITELHIEYEKFKRNPVIFNIKKFKKIIQIYENVFLI